MGIFSIYLAVFNYLADTYHRYASSALAAQSFCKYLCNDPSVLPSGRLDSGLPGEQSPRSVLRSKDRTADIQLKGRNMLGGIFPLITEPMFRRMTIAGASSFLGGVVSAIDLH